MYYANEGLNALIRWIGTLYFHVFHALIFQLSGITRVGASDRIPSEFGKPDCWEFLEKLCGHGRNQMKSQRLMDFFPLATPLL